MSLFCQPPGHVQIANVTSCKSSLGQQNVESTSEANIHNAGMESTGAQMLLLLPQNTLLLTWRAQTSLFDQSVSHCR